MSLTGAETLHMLGRVLGRTDVAYLEELIGRFAFDPSRKVRSYSKGNRQKLALIAGLASRADLLLLDEPTGAHGVGAARRVADAVAQLRRWSVRSRSNGTFAEVAV